MSERTVKIGTEGKQIEITVNRPSTVEEFLKSGVSEDSINQMLIADDSRRVAAHARPLIKEDKNESEIVESCNNYVFVAGRKSSGKVGEARTKGRAEGFSMFTQLSEKELKKLSNLPKDEQARVFALPSVEKMKEALK